MIAAPGRRSLSSRVDVRLHRLVERRGSLVDEDPVGLEKERAREGEPLLLADRKRHRPVRRSRRAARRDARAGRLRAPRGMSRRRSRRRARDRSAHRAACRSAGRDAAAGRATRHPAGVATSPLPNGQSPASTRKSVVLPLPEGPLTDTRLARPDDEARLVEQQLAVRQPHVDIADLERIGRRRRDLDARLARARSLARSIASPNEVSRSTTAIHAATVGNASTNQESAPCTCAERAGRLRQHAERNDAGEIARRGDDDRKDRCATWP